MENCCCVVFSISKCWRFSHWTNVLFPELSHFHFCGSDHPLFCRQSWAGRAEVPWVQDSFTHHLPCICSALSGVMWYEEYVCLRSRRLGFSSRLSHQCCDLGKIAYFHDFRLTSMDIGCCDEYVRTCKRNACTVYFSINITRFPLTMHTMPLIAGG